MALFALTLGVVDQVDKHQCDVIWYSEKSQQ
jgi:aspartate carbamoyltransferase catalytic subunit